VLRVMVNYGQDVLRISVNCDQVLVLWSELLYTCAQEESSVIKTICEDNVRLGSVSGCVEGQGELWSGRE